MHDVILTLYYHAYWLIPVAAQILVISWLLDRIIELLSDLLDTEAIH